MMKGLKGPSGVINDESRSVNYIFKRHLRKKQMKLRWVK